MFQSIICFMRCDFLGFDTRSPRVISPAWSSWSKAPTMDEIILSKGTVPGNHTQYPLIGGKCSTIDSIIRELGPLGRWIPRKLEWNTIYHIISHPYTVYTVSSTFPISLVFWPMLKKITDFLVKCQHHCPICQHQARAEKHHQHLIGSHLGINDSNQKNKKTIRFWWIYHDGIIKSGDISIFQSPRNPQVVDDLSSNFQIMAIIQPSRTVPFPASPKGRAAAAMAIH